MRYSLLFYNLPSINSIPGGRECHAAKKYGKKKKRKKESYNSFVPPTELDLSTHDLLQQMMDEVPSVRPAVISTEAGDMLNEYCGFRHIVRNVYACKLDPSKVGKLVLSAQDTFINLNAELLAFIPIHKKIIRLLTNPDESDLLFFKLIPTTKYGEERLAVKCSG